jgi:hypothetical protein
MMKSRACLAASSGQALSKFVLLFLCGAAVLAPAFAQEAWLPAGARRVFAPIVTRMAAEKRRNFVKLSWTDTEDAKGPVSVYRSASPFSGDTAALPAPALVPWGQGFFIDEIDSAGDFYYFAAASDGKGKKYLVPIPLNNLASVTITEDDIASGWTPPPPPEVAASAAPIVVPPPPPEMRIRTMPLPSLETAGSRAPSAKTVDAATEKAIQEAAAHYGSAPASGLRREPDMFGEETADTALGEIVREAFTSGDMAKAEKDLRAYLASPESPEAASRARYYLGEIYYLEGKDREALFEFLYARDKYRPESQRWIEAILAENH